MFKLFKIENEYYLVSETEPISNNDGVYLDEFQRTIRQTFPGYEEDFGDWKDRKIVATTDRYISRFSTIQVVLPFLYKEEIEEHLKHYSKTEISIIELKHILCDYTRDLLRMTLKGSTAECINKFVDNMLLNQDSWFADIELVDYSNEIGKAGYSNEEFYPEPKLDEINYIRIKLLK